jgi:hypothetical protein
MQKASAIHFTVTHPPPPPGKKGNDSVKKKKGRSKLKSSKDQ